MTPLIVCRCKRYICAGKKNVFYWSPIQFGWIVISPLNSKGKAVQWTPLAAFCPQCSVSLRNHWFHFFQIPRRSWLKIVSPNKWMEYDGMVFMACSRKVIFGGADFFFAIHLICPWRFCCMLPLGGKCFLSQCLGVSLLLNMQLGRNAYLITLLNQAIVLVT